MTIFARIAPVGSPGRIAKVSKTLPFGFFMYTRKNIMIIYKVVESCRERSFIHQSSPKLNVWH